MRKSKFCDEEIAFGDPEQAKQSVASARLQPFDGRTPVELVATGEVENVCGTPSRWKVVSAANEGSLLDGHSPSTSMPCAASHAFLRSKSGIARSIRRQKAGV